MMRIASLLCSLAIVTACASGATLQSNFGNIRDEIARGDAIQMFVVDTAVQSYLRYAPPLAGTDDSQVALETCDDWAEQCFWNDGFLSLYVPFNEIGRAHV